MEFSFGSVTSNSNWIEIICRDSDVDSHARIEDISMVERKKGELGLYIRNTDLAIRIKCESEVEAKALLEFIKRAI